MRFYWALLANFPLAVCGVSPALSAPTVGDAPVSVVIEQVIQAVKTQNALALDRATVGIYEFRDRSGLEWKLKAPAILEKLRGCQGKVLDSPGGFLQGQVGHITWICAPDGGKADPCRDPVYTGNLIRFSNGYLLQVVEDATYAAYYCRASQR